MFLGEGSPFPPTNEIRSLFARADGEIVQEGDLFRNPEYAKTLQRIAQEGPRALYTGTDRRGDRQRVTHREPHARHHDAQGPGGLPHRLVRRRCAVPTAASPVCVPPPPSSGVSLLQMLEILDHTDIASALARTTRRPGSCSRRPAASCTPTATATSPTRASYRCRCERLLDPAYVKLRAQLIGTRAGATPQPGVFASSRGRDASNESAGTSHFVVVDADGNVVSMTTTVESVFGSGRTVGGFVLNNQLTDFSFNPTEGERPVANAVHGGKRPRSSMAPIIVLDHANNFVAALGSPGGSAILDYNAKTLVGLLAWKLSLQQAIELPNLIARGDIFSGELNKFTPALLAGLRERGVELQPGHAENSGLHAVLRHPDGTFEGAADSRREGVARMLPTPQKQSKHAAGGSKAPLLQRIFAFSAARVASESPGHPRRPSGSSGRSPGRGNRAGRRCRCSARAPGARRCARS